jgi:hypothetical protein
VKANAEPGQASGGWRSPSPDRPPDSEGDRLRSYSRAVATVLDEVVRTATQVLERRRSAREAVTILATLTREAEKTARDLRRSEPERAAAYRDLVLAIETELRRRAAASDEPPQVRAVVDDLGRLVKALE